MSAKKPCGLNSRVWVIVGAFVAAWVGSTGTLAAAEGARQADAPNVLLIVSEDNGPELGCYGDQTASTPHLDRLAARGVRFSRAFVTTASCSESRSSILTGLYPHQNGQIGLATHKYAMYRPTANSASLLKGRGYRTGLIGKLHVNPESAFPFDFRWRDPKFCSFSHRDVRKIADVAKQFITAGDEPFFLMVSYPDAHLPFLRQQNGIPAEPVSAPDVKPLPWVGVDTPDMRKALANYYNCLSRLDTGIGMLLDALEKSGRAGNTLVVYLGDHGAQFPRGKLAVYESSLHVPLILHWPGKIGEGLVSRELVSTVDILPTILEATATKPPRVLAGRSLLPLARGESVSWRESLCAEYHGHYPPLYFPQRTIRDDRYKLIVNLLQDRPNPIAEACTRFSQPSYLRREELATAGDAVRRAYQTWAHAPPIELYDLKDDPHEFNNLAGRAEYAHIQDRLQAELARWQKETADPLTDPQKLAALTAEHDAIGKPYRKRSVHWKYREYLSASVVKIIE